MNSMNRISRHRVLYIATFILLICAIADPPRSLHAQPSSARAGALFGRITDLHGRPVAGAMVHIESTSLNGLAHSDGRFLLQSLPAGSYTVLIAAAGFPAVARSVTIRAGEGTNLDVGLRATTVGSSLFFQSDDPHPAIPFAEEILPGSNIHLRAYRILDPTAFYLALGLLPVGAAGARRAIPAIADSADRITSGICGLVREWEYMPGMRLANGMAVDNVPLPFRSPGVYIIEMTSPSSQTTSISSVVISDIGIIIKHAGQRTFAFAADARSGRRLPGVRLTYGSAGSKRHATTGADGIAELRGDGEHSMSGRIVVIGEKSGNFVEREVEIGADASTLPARIHFQTDRPVYRPGQTIDYRGIVRFADDEERYHPLESKSATIEVMNEQGEEVYRATQKLSDLGTFSGELCFGEDCHLGEYTARVSAGGGSDNFVFTIAEYKKPEFTVTVAPERARYLASEHIRATINGRYLFGAPVANAEVEYKVYRMPLGSGVAGTYRGGGSNEPSLDMIMNNKGRLRADGTFAVDIPTEFSTSSDYLYRIEAIVVDASRRAIEGSAEVNVVRSEYAVAARSDKNFYRAGERASIAIDVSRFDGRASGALQYSITGTRRFVEWIDGAWRNCSEECIAGSGYTSTDGHVTIPFPVAHTGTIELNVQIGTSHPTSATARFATIDAKDARRVIDATNARVIPEHDSYRTGDLINALVLLPARPADMLVSMGASRMLSCDVHRAEGMATIVSIPAKEGSAPNVFIDVAAIAGGRLVTSSAAVDVEPVEKKLAIEIAVARSTFKPGDSTRVTFRALDYHGHPVRDAELAVAGIDESIFSLSPDRTPDLASLLPARRGNGIVSACALATELPLYFDGNRKRIALVADLDNSARTNIQDAVALSSGVTTSGVNGFSIRGGRASETRIRVDAIDVNDPFESKMPTSITSTSATMIASSAQIAVDDAAPVPGAYLLPPRLRSTFKDQMAWAPALRTDDDGYAHLDLRFPDNLTTWRITARGVTASTQIGEKSIDLVARKDLLIRMEAPRFITQGDSLLLATTVHNYLSTAKRVTVRLSGENAEVGGGERTISIGPNQDARVDWPLAVRGTDTVKLTAKALTDEESDAMEISIPVVPHGLKGGVSASGELGNNDEADTLRLDIPERSIPATRAITLQLSPSVGSSMIGALDDLIGYPYGCAEQTMTRFLPTVVVANTLKELDMPFDTARQKEIPAMVATGLERLYGFQHSDGGWGWWVNDATNPFMTAYVLYGLTVAREAGFTIPRDRYDRAVASLREQLERAIPQPRKLDPRSPDARSLDAATLAYMLFVSSTIHEAHADRFYVERIEALARNAESGEYPMALLALAARNHGDAHLADSLAPMLASQIAGNKGAAQWAVASHTGRWQSDPVESASYALRALLASPHGWRDDIESGFNWLVAQRQGSSWSSTRQTAMALYALADYAHYKGEAARELDVVVTVNGNATYRMHIDTNSFTARDLRLTLRGGELKAGTNTIIVRREGEGGLHFSASGSYYLDGESLDASDRGFHVERAYYKLERELRDNRYVYVERPFTGTVKSGDELLVKVTVHSAEAREYVLLEDPLPAGCEVVDDVEGYTIDGESEYQGAPSGARDGARDGWRWWYSSRERRDEKLAFFASKLEEGDHSFSYILRAQIPGTYSVMPSVGMLNYFPDIHGNSDAAEMRIE
jgi:uncharacterized protein YfaS (alpha-2-macroglobulin family)